MNGQLSLTLNDNKTKIRVYVRNMTDKKYYIYISRSPAGDDAAAAAPRTFGVAVSRSF